jgi:hypothetical protein
VLWHALEKAERRAGYRRGAQVPAAARPASGEKRFVERPLLADFVAKVVCWLGGDCIEFFDGDG